MGSFVFIKLLVTQWTQFMFFFDETPLFKVIRTYIRILTDRMGILLGILYKL